MISLKNLIYRPRTAGIFVRTIVLLPTFVHDFLCKYRYLLILLHALSCFLLLIPNSSYAQGEKIYSYKDLNRLFTTADQRRYLDKNRKKILLKNNRGLEDSQSKKASKGSAATLSGTSDKQVRLSGVVVREDGKEFFWVNGKQLSRSEAENIFGYPVPNLQERQSSSGVKTKKRNIIPGQVWLPEKKLIKEGYEVSPVVPLGSSPVALEPKNSNGFDAND